MPKSTTRYLRLQIKAFAPGVSKAKVRSTLEQSIRRGTYTYPKNWKVGILWSNHRNAPMKSGEFTIEMRRSAVSSPGWDFAVLEYLRNN